MALWHRKDKAMATQTILVDKISILLVFVYSYDWLTIRKISNITVFYSFVPLSTIDYMLLSSVGTMMKTTKIRPKMS